MLVIASKLIRIVSVLIVCCSSWLVPSFDWTKLRRKLWSIGTNTRGEDSEKTNPLKQTLCEFVLHLEGEEELVQMIMRKGCEVTDHWIHKGKKLQPTHLIDLLRNSTSSQGYRGVAEFDSDNVPNIGSGKPTPNCWALPLVTLATIAAALPGTDCNVIKSLLCGVNEGLAYVRLIDKDFDKGKLKNAREAADIVWVCLDLHNRWLDEKLHKLALEESSARVVIEKLAEAGKKQVLDFTLKCLEKMPYEWPPKVLAANAMYRICQTILEGTNHRLEMNCTLLQWLQATIADILAACLTNLPRVISMELICSAIEVRDASVRKAAHLLGETETILKTLGQQPLPDMDPKCMVDMDEWRLMKERNPS